MRIKYFLILIAFVLILMEFTPLEKLTGFARAFDEAGASSLASLRFAFNEVGTSSLASLRSAQEEEPADKEECNTRLECEELLKEYESKIAEYEKEISGTKDKSKTLKNKIALLKKEIEKLILQIRQSNAMIKDLGIEIGDTENSIDKTILEIENYKKNLAVILRAIYKEDQKSYVEVLLAGNDLSDFFNHLTELDALNLKNQEILGNIETSKSFLETQKKNLEEDKDELEKIVKVKMLQRNENESVKKENDAILKLTEAQYQKYLKEKEAAEKKAAEIRARIFELLGVVKAPTFEEAYNIAKYVSGTTGVRTALILAILTQESNIGKNVGQCYLKDVKTGDGIRIKTGDYAPKTMNPKNIVYFLPLLEDINKAKGLSRNAFETPVSCVMYSNGKPYGWGGAMGPGQFMPSTWVKSGYGKKVEEIRGKTGDPWDINDAFLATGLYLKDLGGANKSGEFRAVMSYFSGASWTKWEEFYGRSVMSIASGYEDDIAAMEKNN